MLSYEQRRGGSANTAEEMKRYNQISQTGDGCRPSQKMEEEREGEVMTKVAVMRDRAERATVAEREEMRV